MNLQEITYKSLCQNLADSEIGLRRNAKVNTAAKGGRADQLAYMETHFPTQWIEYRESLLNRLQKPFDSVTALSAIPWGVEVYG